MSSKASKEITRCGTFIHTFNDLNIGIEIEIDTKRPLVLAHPAAGNHYHASMSFAQELNHPFIQVVIDQYPHFPDTWPNESSTAGIFMKYQRLNDTVDGDPVFRVCDEKQPHWQIQVANDANIYLRNIPEVDILYLDWIDWIDDYQKANQKGLDIILENASNYVRDGGLIILDHKHELRKLFFPNFTDDCLSHFGDSNNSCISYSGEIEWLGENSSSEFTAYNASVFTVKKKNQHSKELDNYQQWFKKLIPEFAMSIKQINHVLKSNLPQYQHVDAYTWDMHNNSYIEQLKNDVFYPQYSDLIPPKEAWEFSSYQKFLAWLLENNHLLSDELIGRCYHHSFSNHKVSIFHGDIVELAPLLFHDNYFIAVRKALSKKITNRFPWWKESLVTLQTNEPWASNPIQDMTWSGANVSIKLIEEIMTLGTKKFKDRFHKRKIIPSSFNIITIANGTGDLNELLRAFEHHITSVKGDCPFEMNLTVIHVDDFDYLETSIDKSWIRVEQAD